MKDKRPRHPYYSMYSSFEDDEKRLLMTITGFGEGRKRFKVSKDSIPGVKLVFQSYYPWIKSNKSNIYSLRFEDLVDDEDKCKSHIEKLVNFISPKITINDNLIHEIKTRGMDPGRSHTYRKGVINTWKDEYNNKHIKTFREYFGDHLLGELGYDWNGNINI